MVTCRLSFSYLCIAYIIYSLVDCRVPIDAPVICALVDCRCSSKDSSATSVQQNNPNQGWDAVAQIDIDDSPPTLPQVQQNQEHRDRIQGEMDMMGTGSLQSMDYDEQAALPREDGEQHTNESLEKLSLWQTLKVMYKRKPMCKFYILGLLILLAATAAIIGVSISKSNSSGNKDCASASYNSEEPFLLLPEQSSSVRAGGFGTSISASAEYLVVGAPNPACNSKVSSCDDFTIGGAAYMYKRNSNNKWSIYSSFILDDGISTGDKFGTSVAIDTDSTTVVIGSPQDDGLGIQAGAIYVLEKPFSSTTAPIRLVSEDIGVKDEFGGSVSVSVTTIGTDSPVRVTNVVVGASKHDSFGSSSGAVYVFSKFEGEPPADACGGIQSIEVGKWIQCQKLLPDDGETNDQFGKACDISGRTLVVGAMWVRTELSLWFLVYSMYINFTHRFPYRMTIKALIQVLLMSSLSATMVR